MPQSTPMPVGPVTLWPVKTTKSAPTACTSTGSCGAACEASSTTSAPTSWARRAISATGLIVPSMLETQVSETTLVSGVISSSMFDRSSWPSSVSPNQRSSAPLRSVSSCQGTMLEWCSISVITTRSPALISSGPAHAIVLATRFSASLAFLVKITSSRDGALRNRATLSRPASNASEASAPSWCIARATLALCRSRWSTMVSITTCGFCEVFALSR